MASLLTGNRHQGEELLQESLVNLYTRWKRVARDGDPHAYLRQDRRSALIEPHDSLQRAVLRLPRQQRAVIVLRYFEDLSEKDAATVLGCSVGAIKSTHSRALAKLRAESALLETHG